MESPYTVEESVQSTDGSTEIQQQIGWLMRELGRELVHLRTLKSQLAEDEKRLNQFMHRYMEQVGDCVVAARSSRHAAFLWNDCTDGPQAASEVEAASPYAEKSIQRLYRRLAKIFHPDKKQEGAASSRYFHMLQEAYEKGDVHTLVRLEVLAAEGCLLFAETDVQRLERLEQRYQSVLNEKDRLLVKHHAIKISSEWELMVRVQAWGSRSGEVVNKIRSAMLAERGLSAA